MACSRRQEDVIEVSSAEDNGNVHVADRPGLFPFYSSAGGGRGACNVTTAVGTQCSTASGNPYNGPGPVRMPFGAGMGFYNPDQFVNWSQPGPNWSGFAMPSAFFQAPWLTLNSLQGQGSQGGGTGSQPHVDNNNNDNSKKAPGDQNTKRKDKKDKRKVETGESSDSSSGSCLALKKRIKMLRF